MVPSDPPHILNSHSTKQGISIWTGEQVTHSPNIGCPLRNPVRNLGASLRLCDANRDGKARPLLHRAADLSPGLSEIPLCKSPQTQKGFVNRIDFEIGTDLFQGLHDPLGHIAVERVVAGKYLDVVSTEQGTNLKLW